MRCGLFPMAEYINMITLSGLAVTLFFGGWGGPGLPGPIWFLIKLRLHLRLHLDPRHAAAPRYDQLMRFGWKVLLPVATLNAVVTAILVVAAVSPQPLESLKGFAVTFRQIFKKPITQQYPEYKRPVYPRFRGRHRLWRHENGLEKCVGCSLCAAACPADCIRVVAAENTPDNRVSPGERYARIYEINLSRCIFCGYCELACPFDAITLEAEYELSEYSRDDLIYTKDMLLAAAGQARAGGRPRPLRHARSRSGRRRASGGRSLMADVLVWIVWVRRGRARSSRRASRSSSSRTRSTARSR